MKFISFKNSFLILSVALLAFSCQPENDTQSVSEIAKNWNLDSIENAKTGEIKESKPEEYLTILYDEDEDEKRFAFTLYDFAEKDTDGSWILSSEDTLTLVPDPDDIVTNVDSLVYIVDDGNPMLIYYHEGTEVARQFEDRLQGEKKPLDFIIEKITENKLVLSHNNKAYYFQHSPTELPFEESFGITSVIRGILGLLLLIGIAYIFSANRKAISWSVVAKGLSIQILLAFAILKIGFVQDFFHVLSSFFVIILDFSQAGAEFLLDDLVDVDKFGFIFAFQVLPTIIFFSALTSVLYYLKIIQFLVYVLAWLMVKAMRLSGTESLSVAGNIFLGQTESPLLIKAYLPDMNKSEILLVMIGGMATIAGGVLAAYISFLGGDDPAQRLYFANHLLAASIMAAPGAVVVSKILMPQTEDISKEVSVSKEKIGDNVLEAMTKGTGEGLRLAVNVAAMLLVFVAFVAMINYVLKDFIGGITGINPLIEDFTNGQYEGFSMQFILGYIFAPLVWSVGVTSQDMALVGQLLGEKIVMSEFIAYISLAELKDAEMFASEKSIVMATYMLCGFANFASIGIQIGGIGSLAPNQRTLLSRFGMRALLGGSIASLFSATIVGMLF